VNPTGSAPAESPGAATRRAVAPAGGRGAALIAAGILVSRLLGLVRHRLFATWLGVSDFADAFNAAFRIPNFLQNLFGEGVLSASFIPVYAGLHARGDDDGRRQVATAVLSLLLVTTSVIVLLGILFAAPLTRALAPGYAGAKYELTVHLVRILFPGAALLVLSAWTLGVLNSHRRFFLSYASAALWNVAMIATLVAFGPRREQGDLVVLLAWGSVAGSLLQFGAQLPAALRLLDGLRLRWRARAADVRVVVRNFLPVFVGRGVAQISGLVDTVIASLLGTGAQSALSYAQLLYMLPVSLFGMSVSAAELPEMSRLMGGDADALAALRERTRSGLRRIAFFVVPSSVAFVALGDQVADLVYRSGAFGAAETEWVWGVLAGAAVGLVASTQSRLFSSAFYALRDPRTPFRYAVLRVLIASTLGATLALGAPRLFGIDPRWSVAGITVASGLAGWVEYTLLRRALTRRIGDVALEPRIHRVLWGAAALAAAVAWVARTLNEPTPTLLRAALVLAVFGMVYWVATWRAGVPEAVELRRTIFRRPR
jgi:putative peptidoglycan lipid II flippase